MNPVTSSPGSPYISPLIILLLYTLHCSQIKLLSGSQPCSPLSCPQAFLFCKTHLSLPHLITLLTPIEFSAQLSFPLPLPQPAWANWLFHVFPQLLNPLVQCCQLKPCLHVCSLSLSLFLTLSPSLTPWRWVWVNSGSWWQTGRPDVLQFMGSQRVGQDWATGLNWFLVWSYVHLYHFSRFHIHALMNSIWSSLSDLLHSVGQNLGLATVGKGKVRWNGRLGLMYRHYPV